ncbi:hypothetical protein R4B61_05075 [Fructilactobacillus vespulae]|uniref:hypothetical protein n=1 Tax=Fructilactobacillus vespulae TaxID=1249630 RepID=UPI0039B3EC61
MEEQLLATEMKNSVEKLLPELFEDSFIKGIIKGHLSTDVLVNYVQQDNLYLEEFIKLDSQLLKIIQPKDYQEVIKNLKGENIAHDVLLKAAVRTNQQVMSEKIQMKLTTHLYLIHLQESVEKSPSIGLAAMQACPYVYSYLADQVLQNISIDSNNPFKEWLQFYSSKKNDFTSKMFEVLNQLGRNVNDFEFNQAITAFEKSCEYELDFFRQAVEDL